MAVAVEIPNGAQAVVEKKTKYLYSEMLPLEMSAPHARQAALIP